MLVKRKIRRMAWLCILTILCTCIPIHPMLQLLAGTGGVKGTVMPAGYVTDNQLKLAMAWEGMDESGVFDVMRKAMNGQRVTIAFIGGSITKGTYSRGTLDASFRKDLTYTDYFSDWWYKQFPRADMRFINAGIGATDSYLGVHRVQKDVLDKSPDLVVVEFAVNDKKTAYHKQAYENLVRKIMAAKSKPAVLLLFSCKTDGSSCQYQQSKIGKHYYLPMLSYANVIKDMMKKGIYTAEELSGDGIHPSMLAQAIYGEILVRYFMNIYERRLNTVVRKKAPTSWITSESYKSAKMVKAKNLTLKKNGSFLVNNDNRTFPGALKTSKGSGNLTFTVKCKNLGLLYSRQTDGKGGQFDVYVDGKKITTLDAEYSKGKNNHAESVPIYSSKKIKNHTVRIVKTAHSTGNEFTLYGALVSN